MLRFLGSALIISSFFLFSSTTFAAFATVDCTSPADRLTLGGGASELPEAECLALGDLWSVTGGDTGAWTDATGWDTVTSINTWFGMNLDPTGNISEIELTGNGLTGTLPASIADLTLMRVLQIQNNSLTGAFPDITANTELEDVYIFGNTFSGPLPDITNAVNMVQFRAENNEFTGPVNSIVGLNALTNFRVGGNNLTGTIPDPSANASLKFFYLNGNDLTGTIPAINNATIEDIRIFDNQLTGPLPDFSVMPSLRIFQANSNLLSGDSAAQFSSFPASMVQIVVNDNDLSGDLSAYAPTPNLTRLRLNNNMFEGDISGWVLPAGLEWLQLADNAFAGDIPDLSTMTAPNTVGTSLENNQFVTTDAAKDAAADTATASDWSATQTIAPTNASTTAQTATDVTVSVDTYEYVAVGDFTLSYGVTSTGPYTTGSTTAARSAGTDFVVTGLTENTLYFGVVAAETPANAGDNVLVATSSEFLMVLQTTPDLATTSDDGLSDTDNITSNTTPEITGECAVGATVEIYVDGVATGDTAVCDATGMYSVTLTTPLAPGTVYDITHTQTDLASGLSTPESPILMITIDQDTDGDGFPDSVETAAGSDPTLATSVPVDTDGDGFPDYFETTLASPATDETDTSLFPMSPDPLATDTDGDGFPDWLEIAAGSDPTLDTSVPTDTDGDLVPDVVELMQGTDPALPLDYMDTDGDLVPNYIEAQDGTDATDPTVGGFLDTDGDLVPDYVEVTLQVNEGGAATDETNGAVFLDTDLGGTPDYVEVTLFPNEGLTATDINVAADDTQNSDSQSPDDYNELLAGTDPLVAISSGGGGGGSSSKVCRDPEASNYKTFGKSTPSLCEYDDEEEEETTTTPVSNPVVSTDSVCAPYLTKTIGLGRANDSQEVEKLQLFLNENEGESLTVDGIYNQDDFEAVKRFQAKYASSVLDVWGLTEPTGYVYLTTRMKINSFKCNKTLECPIFSEYNRFNQNSNTAEVQKTKVFMTELGFYNGAINTLWDNGISQAITNFQETFKATMLTPWGLTKGTGYKYKTTNKFMNELVGCSTPSLLLENGVTVNY